MNKTRQIFETKQAQVLVCGSGRVMVAINEEKLKATEQVPVAMTKNGVMKYETREKTQYAYDVYWITLPSSSNHDSAAVLQAAVHRCLQRLRLTTLLRPSTLLS